jgi:NAD(P)-dependent dehydrogenase (short-subunit alcohol dehydrogenase family)
MTTRTWLVTGSSRGFGRAPAMRERGRGRIIQFSSVGGRLGAPGRVPYSAAKWRWKASPGLWPRRWRASAIIATFRS